MAAVTSPVAGTVRVQVVYTPDALRNRGYAAASVARLTSMVAHDGTRCVYRHIGYRAVAEVLRYQFA